jgi:hypothetical protein
VERTANKNIASGYAGLDGTARIAKAQGHSATVYNDQANTYSTGSKQTFQNSGTTAGFNLASSADPSTPAQGDVWVNTSDLKFRGAAATQTAERQANKGVASGYASLDGSVLVPVAQLPPAATTEVFEWVISGNIATGTDLDGLRIMPRAGTIVMVTSAIRIRGTGGSTIADVNRTVPTKPITTQRNATAPTGTTVYTTQGDRPTLAGGSGGGTESAVIEAADPAVTSFVAGDYFAMDIDAIATGAGANAPKDLTVQMTVQYTS